MTDSCTQASVRSKEGLLGSAPANTDYWLLIESRAPFAPKVVKKSPLADTLRPLTERLITSIPTARVQFIRRPETKKGNGPLHAFVADSRGRTARLFARQFETYEELFDIEWNHAQHDRGPNGFSECTVPIVLICTHGKRDACCALYGRSFLKGLSDNNREYVWEASHIGGHRFAATCVTLPFGHYFGRLKPSDANLLVEATLQGRLYDTEHFRGSASLPQAAQIVEGKLREKHQTLDIEAVQYLGETQQGAHAFQIAGVDGPQEGTVTSIIRDDVRIKSCGGPPEPFSIHTVTWID